MPSNSNFRKIFHKLLGAYGAQSWWPADSPFEVMVGAILTQNTSWAGVEKAMANLKGMKALSPGTIAGLDRQALEAAVRPSGYYRQKAERLQILSRFIMNGWKGNLSCTENLPTEELREQLLDLKGVGPETADSILLYAFDRPVFVIDAYTVRLLSRLGLCSEKVKYHDLQALFMDSLDPDAKLFNEYHALIVRHCKVRCMKRAPLCAGCVLEGGCGFNTTLQAPNPKK